MGKSSNSYPWESKGEHNTYFTHEQQEIETKTEVKDLGIYIASDMSFKYHITTMVGKARRMANWALRVFNTRKTFPMKILLKTLIITILEYGSVVWSPNKSNLINLIESVQRYFTSRMEEFCTWDEELGMYTCTTRYWERLQILKIYSLERRRERFMIIFIYKIMIGAYPNPGIVDTYYEERSGIRVKSKLNFRAPGWVKTARISSFFNIAPKLYNILPRYLRDPNYIVEPTKDNIDAFKKEVDNFLGRIPDQPYTQGREKERVALTNSILDQVRHIRPE
jgi:hypothetical protein